MAVLCGWLLLGSSQQSQRAGATVPPGTLDGRLLAVGGPVMGPRPVPHQTFWLTRVGATASYAVRTDRRGRFTIHLPQGAYRFSMPQMTLVRRSGQVVHGRRVFRVRRGRTLRAVIVVTNPEWA